MEDETMNITIECGSWIKLNHDFIGYYRVQYEPDYLNAFLPDISSHKMSELNRLSLLDDLMAAVQCGRISTNVVLKFISTGFRLEESYVVWICINNCFSKLLMLLSDDDEATKMLKVFILDIMSHIIESVGWKAKKGEHHTRGLLRMVIISRMGQLGHAKTVAEAKMRFAEHVSGTNKLEADLRAPVYTTVMANGDRETFDKMVSLYCSEDLHEEKDRIARSMGSATNFDILHSVLQFAISDHVRSQDSPSAIAAVASNPKGRDAAWVFYKSKSALFMERYMSGMMHSRLVKSVTENFASADRANAVETFFTMSFNPAERTVQQSVENVMLNEAWLKRDGENMKKFLV
jgi:puromycin-sensitive aminopeptidase